jgi:hypothetical protein
MLATRPSRSTRRAQAKYFAYFGGAAVTNAFFAWVAYLVKH